MNGRSNRVDDKSLTNDQIFKLLLKKEYVEKLKRKKNLHEEKKKLIKSFNQKGH